MRLTSLRVHLRKAVVDFSLPGSSRSSPSAADPKASLDLGQSQLPVSGRSRPLRAINELPVISLGRQRAEACCSQGRPPSIGYPRPRGSPMEAIFLCQSQHVRPIATRQDPSPGLNIRLRSQYSKSLSCQIIKHQEYCFLVIRIL